MTRTEQMAETYQVFINHRGPDTKKNLASAIYHRLTRCHGLRVFLDMMELQPGNTVYPAIRRAIDSSSVHIALFSKGYADSRPCLNELCWMLGSSHERKIIPIFCDVEPRDLKDIEPRDLKGTNRKRPYAKAFEKYQLEVHKGDIKTEVMQGWKEALSEAADISGVVFKTDESDQGEFLEEIVKLVLKSIKWELLDVATYPVGLDEAAKDFQNKIMKGSTELNATKMVTGIAGMAGVGKSTLAKHLYNVRRSDFGRSCYLFNFRENDIPSLQQKLVLDLLGYDVHIRNTSQGKRILRDGLRGIPILVVFDDVDDNEKVKSLLDMDAVEPRSLILITSRDKYILRGCSANILLYDVKPLRRKHARELFCRHAFRQSKPFQGYGTLVKEFLKICGGLPLCLQVLGEQLAAKLDGTYWMPQLNKFFSQGLPLPEADAVIKRLMWSYEALNPEQKEIFLDIGCFLVGEETELAIRILQSLGWHNARGSLEVLRQKCFVDFRSDVLDYYSEDAIADISLPNVLSKGCYKIIMHEQVRELARHIARKDFNKQIKPLRLSCSYDIQQLLQRKSASSPCEIRGIRIPEGQNPPQLTINITGLRLLVVEHPVDFSLFTGSWIWGWGCMSGDLLWLRLSNCSLGSIPSTISLRNLRVLELEGSDSDLRYSFRRVWKEGYPEQLQELNIQFSTETSPDFGNDMVRIIGQSINLNKIEFKNNSIMRSFRIDLFNLTNLHFSMLTNLRHLDLSGSTNLIQLPTSFSTCLRLQYLSLRDCTNLSFPKDILGEISTLEYVDFSGCAQLLHLPKGLAYQKSLRCLDLLRTSLSQLPENLELLNKLEELRIGSPNLTELPDSVADLVGLKELILLECPGLQLHQINTSIERLTSLEKLVINNSTVPILPAGIAQLKYINVLGIEHCPEAEFNFDQRSMALLRELNVKGTLISKICIGENIFPSLEIVNLSDNSQLIRVEGSLPSTLVTLELANCSKLKALPNLSKLANLKFLNIVSCKELETLNVEGLASLEVIKVEECSKLQEIEALSQLKRLNHLQISTNNENNVICDEVFQILASPSQISTAFFTAIADVHKIEFENVVRGILSTFGNLTVFDVPATTTSEPSVMLENPHSYGAILMFFISQEHGFGIRFEAGNNPCKYKQFGSINGTGSAALDIMMWTEDSKLFKDETYNKVIVNSLSGKDADKGWIVPLTTKTEGTEVCKKLMCELSSTIRVFEGRL